QDKIVAILSALDEKIETNRKINARLEELAQALFKSWFIDFEPFGGQMPEDWKNVTLSDIGDIIGGATPSKEHSEYYAKVGNGIAWLTPKDLSETNAKFTARGSLDITNLGYQKCSTKLIPCGSILFSSRAPIGYVSIALNEICTNQGFKSFIPKQVGTAFSYYLLKTLTPEIENKSTGSTFKEASGSLMKSLQVFLPDKETLSRFEEICTPIFDKQRDCEIESTRLAELRDSLLPKLMSGELIPE
ncbi:restriction endonuclease subunit S, partial [Lactobacillus intestinalis]|uniref:restriction endonuclease subunit S n=1 Tax=Lactobacillus intestinalis TaxID=151781 RepID=UPI0025AFD42F